jgi:hypothetical protein
MDKDEALRLLSELGGDEHVWVDLKSDYYIKGSPYLEAEFVKDIQSMANAIDEREERYLLIGCDEEEGVVGVPDGAEDESSETRHILSFDEDDLQEIIDSRLSPGPQISLHTFENEGLTFGVLVITRIEKPPCITTSKLEDVDAGNVELRENEIWMRKASGKKEVDRDEFQTIVDYRIDQERESLMRGIRRVVELDPDSIATIGELEPNEKAEADITFSIDDEGDYTVSSEVTRDSFTELSHDLEADIHRRNSNPKHYTSLYDLMRYYSGYDQLDLDKDAIRLLTESALKHWIPGVLWLTYTDLDEAQEILRSVPDEHSIRTTVCKLLIIIGDGETFDRYLSESSSISNPRFDAANYREQIDKSAASQLNALGKNLDRVEYRDFELELDFESLDQDELRELISEVASIWLECDDDDGRTDLKYALVNLELALCIETF